MTSYENRWLLDQEDLDTHYGLAQAYAQLGEGLGNSLAPWSDLPDSRGILEGLAATFVDPKAIADGGDRAACRLGLARQCTCVEAEPVSPSLNGRCFIALANTLPTVYEHTEDPTLNSGGLCVGTPCIDELHAIYAGPQRPGRGSQGLCARITRRQESRRRRFTSTRRTCRAINR